MRFIDVSSIPSSSGAQLASQSPFGKAQSAVSEQRLQNQANRNALLQALAARLQKELPGLKSGKHDFQGHPGIFFTVPTAQKQQQLGQTLAAHYQASQAPHQPQHGTVYHIANVPVFVYHSQEGTLAQDLQQAKQTLSHGVGALGMRLQRVWLTLKQ